MKRTTAREIAILMCFAASANGLEPAEMMDDFFSEEHYATLSQDLDPSSPEYELFLEYPDEAQMRYIRRLAALTVEKREQVDEYIEKYAHGWKPERLSRTALAILRCALCEILYMEEIPNAAAINEAVELDKKYDGPETVAFVNGVLGGFVRGEFGDPPAGDAVTE